MVLTAVCLADVNPSLFPKYYYGGASLTRSKEKSRRNRRGGFFFFFLFDIAFSYVTGFKTKTETKTARGAQRERNL